MVNLTKQGPPFGKPAAHKVKVKICGITNSVDARHAVRCGADALGFIFYRKSKRFINPGRAKSIIAALPARVKKVGVFVNARAPYVQKVANACALDVLQFHGDEPPRYCARFKGCRVIKAFRVHNRLALNNVSEYRVSAYMFDAYEKNAFGGTGKTFNWDTLKKIEKMSRPVIISGGLTARNVKRAIKKLKPYAVDVSSGVEDAPGKKNPILVRKFIAAAKNAQAR